MVTKFFPGWPIDFFRRKKFSSNAGYIAEKNSKGACLEWMLFAIQIVSSMLTIASFASGHVHFGWIAEVLQ